MKMKVSILAICMAIGCLFFSGCSELQSDAPSEAPGISATRFADLRDNWAWAVVNWDGDNPGGQLAAVSYASPDKLDELTLAAHTDGLSSIQYAGEKQATSENGEYSLFYGGLSGPFWNVAEPFTGDMHDVILISESCRRGVLSFAAINASPPADPGDVTKIEAMKKNRRVVHSELLATDQGGGRVSLFQFENTDYGLLILAYISGDRIIVREFIASVFEGKATWRADLGEDNIGQFEVKLLCETDAGLVIGFSWYGHEGVEHYLLVEETGVFAEFIASEWYFDVWEGRFAHSAWDLQHVELWPDLDPAALLGTWEDRLGDSDYSFTFRADNSGERRSFYDNTPITYSIDGNIIICKWFLDGNGQEGEPYTDFFRAKIEGNQLYLDGYTVLTKLTDDAYG